MASTSQTLDVKITGDSSDFDKATRDAAKSLDTLQKEIDSTSDETIEITPEIQLERLKRDRANLNKILDGIERRKASPDVGMDTTRLLREEAKVKKALKDLDAQSVEIDVDSDLSGLTRLSAMVDDLGLNLGGLSDIVGKGTKAGVFGGLIAGAGIAGVSLVNLAADSETAKVALENVFTGEGQEAFEELNRLAAETPFELDQLVESARKLGSVGVELEDIPGLLTKIGDTASVSGQPIEDLAGIYQQMIAKGKIQQDELLQLSDRGINAAGLLADAMGITTAQLLEQASAGKLAREEIDLLWDTMGEANTGAMARQAETLNGKLTTLGDNVKILGADIGESLADGAEKGVDAMIKLVEGAQWTTDKLQDFSDWLNDPNTKSTGFWDTIGEAAKDLATLDLSDPFNTQDYVLEQKKAKDATKETGDELEDAESKAEDFDRSLSQAHAAEELAADLKDVNEELKDAIDNFTILSGAVEVFEARSDLTDSMKELKEALKDGFSPHIDGSAIIAPLQDIEAIAKARLERGDNPLDVGKFIERSIADMKQLGGPKFDAMIDRFVNKKWPDVLIGIKADQRKKKKTEDEIDQVAEDRETSIYAHTENQSYHQTQNELDALAQDRTVTITTFMGRPGMDDLNRPTPPSTSRSGGGGGGGAGGGGDRPRELRPKQGGVEVHNYIDGEEVASRVERRRNRRGSGRRVP